jgi:hypothetical protein
MAGLFYPADASDCARQIDQFIEQPVIPGAIGGLLPHAGWSYSGKTAGYTIGALRSVDADTVVVFGAVHVADRNLASVYPGGAWETPFGSVCIDDELAGALLRQCPETVADAEIHSREHSIEVEIPFVHRAFPQARILPVMVAATAHAAAIGRSLAQAAASLGRGVVVLASTDLTHYGPRFGFEPHGHGAAGTRWAKEVNDRLFVERVFAMNMGGVVTEAVAHRNACGAGAVAATIAAADCLGAAGYLELDHTSSADCEPAGAPVFNSVGYHAGVFVRSVSAI